MFYFIWIGDDVPDTGVPVPNVPAVFEPQAHNVPSAFRAKAVLPFPAEVFAMKFGNTTGVVYGNVDMLPRPISPD